MRKKPGKKAELLTISNSPERVAAAILRNRKPDAWRAIVDQLPEECRAPVAKIVWWDFFGNRRASNAWTHLDTYLYDREAILEPLALAAALKSVGYTSLRAKFRANIISYDDYKARMRAKKARWKKKVENKCLTNTHAMRTLSTQSTKESGYACSD